MTALPPSQPDDSERRAAPRTRTLKRAKILFNNHFSTFDCVVRNLSATGALLTIDESVHLPKSFDLRIGDDKELRPAQLVYRRGMFAGIRFLDVEGMHGDVPGLAPSSALTPAPTMAAAPEAAAAPSPRARIQKIVPGELPSAITLNLRWHRF
ncbi:PilZ domain-containing protein [Consotaella salsifontis]|uniref:PilZ domain-containing protein n=2 Tax=Consotaella salsifontis TaxID=1365950 RepID=A0A1T4MJE2_9HYPH|nr:PilZ domain-containing protein [Consotaella salsifontis]